MKPVAIGADPNAKELKLALIAYLEELGYSCKDFGSDDPIYANVGFTVAEAVARGEYD
jgi:ribose 5-phosphate isomerase B